MNSADDLRYFEIKFLFCCLIAVCRLFQIVSSHQYCPHPHVPADRMILTEKNRTFELADKVIYSCKTHYFLFGKDSSTCKSNGEWSNSAPFCGDTTIEIRTGKDNGNHYMNWCGERPVHAGTKDWILIECKGNLTVSEWFAVKTTGNTAKNISICEIKAYVEDESYCESPPGFTVDNGFFRISRNKAVLHCETGFKSNNERLACENNDWSPEKGHKCKEVLCPNDIFVEYATTRGNTWKNSGQDRKLSVGLKLQLMCDTGYKKTGGSDIIICQSDGTWSVLNATCKEEGKLSIQFIIAVSAAVVVVAILLISLGIIIYLIKMQRNREVVVVYRNEGSSAPGSESEYGIQYYESVQSYPPPPPTRPAVFPPVLTEYSLPADCKETEQDPVPADNAFNTMKESDLYANE